MQHRNTNLKYQKINSKQNTEKTTISPTKKTLVHDQKGIIFITDILTKYENALIILEPLLFANIDEATKFEKVKIYLVEDKSKQLVLKIVNIKNYIYREKKVLSLEREIEVGKMLGKEHPHFTKVIDSRKNFLDKAVPGSELVMRYEILFKYGGDSLDRLMEKATDEEIEMCLIQSIHAYKYMEHRRVTHFDIKPNNMVYKDGILKVIDFGASIRYKYESSVFKNIASESSDIVGYTSLYASPEVLKHRFNKEKISGSKHDIFCWGLTFYGLITRSQISDIVGNRSSKEKHKEFIKKSKSPKA